MSKKITMKKIIFSLSCLVLTQVAISQKSKTIVTNPKSNTVCNCADLKPIANMWIEGSVSNFTSYVLEIQMPLSNSLLPICTRRIDSLYFNVVDRGVPVPMRNYGTSEFVKTLDKKSGDNKWQMLRYRIPKSLFTLAPVLNQSLGIYYTIKLGAKTCNTIYSSFKITDELL